MVLITFMFGHFCPTTLHIGLGTLSKLLLEQRSKFCPISGWSLSWCPLIRTCIVKSHYSHPYHWYTIYTNLM